MSEAPRRSWPPWLIAANAAGGVLFAWGVFAPRLYPFVIALMVLGPVAGVMIFQLSGGAIPLTRGRGQRGPSVVGLLAAGLGLFVSALIHVQLIDWVNPLLVLAPLGLAIAAAVAVLTGGRGRDAAGVILMLAASVFGLGVHADRLLDQHPGSEVRTAIAGKSVTRGRSTSYHLSLFGVPDGIGSVTVDKRDFDAAHVGDPLCLTVYPGAFGWPWYERHACGSPPAT